MKNLKYILFAVSAVVLFASCEKLLKEDPKYSQNATVVFSTEENAQQALLGCYGYISENQAYGQCWQELPIAASGLSWGRHNGQDQDYFTSLNIPVNSQINGMAWDGMYKVISECNAFIASMDLSDLAESTKAQMVGEAKFLRAVAYYNLTTHFGDVPLKITASSSDGISISRSSQEEVFNQVIQDFTDAAESIDATPNDGYACSWAAKAYLGKVYHMMARLGINSSENYAKAKEAFDEVYASGVFGLESKFGNLWVDHLSGSKESIFQVNFTTESTVCYNRGSNRFAPTYSTAGIAWGTYKVNKYIYDLHWGTYPGDPRMKYNYLTAYRFRANAKGKAANNQAEPAAQVTDVLCANDSTYCYPYLTYTYDTLVKVGKNDDTTKIALLRAARIPYEELSDPSNPSIAELKAYTNSDKLIQATVRKMANQFPNNGNEYRWPAFMKMYDQNAIGTRDHHNLLVYRYAEMLFLMADTYNELGNTSKAVSLVNEVLARARNTASASQPADWSSSMSKEDFTWKLLQEFVFEFAGEPNNFESLRMFGADMFKKLIQKQNVHELTMAGYEKYLTTSAPISDRVLDGGGTISDDFVKKNLLLPVPQTEIDANAGITANDNNYGYASETEATTE